MDVAARVVADVTARERAILFSAPMVKAILAGRKTQTRRIVKPQPWPINDEERALGAPADSHWWPSNKCRSMVTINEMGALGPYGGRGDRLWVRETWGLLDTLPSDGPENATLFYKATDGERRDLRHQLWRPSLFMPRWAARIFLKITAVRVERLQDISEADARAEGVRPIFERFPEWSRDQRITSGELAADAEHRASFAVLWDELNGNRALWVTNPFVWVVSFERVETSRGEPSTFCLTAATLAARGPTRKCEGCGQTVAAGECCQHGVR